MVNGIIYNEVNFDGQEAMIIVDGCDFIVIIDFNFVLFFIDILFLEVCQNSGFNIMVGNINYNEFNLLGEEVL